MKRQVISLLVANRFGALPRIAEIFSSRGYNVDSICSGSCEEPNAQRLTIVCRETIINTAKIIKLLEDLIDVWQVKLVSKEAEIAREMMLAKLNITSDNKAEVLALLNLLNVEIIEITTDQVTFEVAREASEIDKICDSLSSYQIVEMARTGEAAIHR